MMTTHSHKVLERKSQLTANNSSQKQSGSKATFQLRDNRSETKTQAQLQQSVSTTAAPMQLKANPVIQFGAGFSGLAKPKKIKKTKSKGQRQYPDHTYERWYNYRNVRISDLILGEGEKMDAALRENLESAGFDRRFSILVVRETDGTLRVIDGHHRYTEMKHLGQEKIPAYVIPRKRFDAQEKAKGGFYKSGQGW